MTDLSKERLENIKEMAASAAETYGDTWLSSLVGDKGGNYHAITSDHTNDVVVRASDDNRESAWLCDYLEGVSPAAVTALIGELLQRREAAEKPVAWTDEQELRDVEQRGCGYLFTVNPITPNADMRRVIPLFTAPPLPVDHDRLQESAYRAGLTVGWNFGIEGNNEGFNKSLKAHEYAAPHLPVVPDEIDGHHFVGEYHEEYADGWNACRAAMLQAGNYHAAPTRYMNRYTGQCFTLEQQPGADTDTDVYVPLYERMVKGE